MTATEKDVQMNNREHSNIYKKDASMRIRPIAVLLNLLLFLSILGGTCREQPRDKVAPVSEWDFEPDTTDTDEGFNGPTVPDDGPFSDAWCIGSDGTTPGDKDNKVTTPAQKCKGNGDYCVVTFYAQAPLEDNEKIRITLTEGQNTKTGYIEKYSNSSKEYRLAIQGACGEDVTISFDWDAGVDPSGIQTEEAYVWGVTLVCNANNRTNKRVGGKLYNSAGIELNQ